MNTYYFQTYNESHQKKGFTNHTFDIKISSGGVNIFVSPTKKLLNTMTMQ